MSQVNKTTKVGSAVIANRIKGDGTAPKYMGWGTGTTEATTSNTGLETARGESRTSGTETIVTTTETNDTYQVVGTITCASTGFACTEYAQFDASTNGNCVIRSTFTAINLEVGDSIEFTSKLKITAS